MWKICLIFVLLISGCSSLPVHEGLDRVTIGMDKDSVLNLAGNPAHTYHKNSQDHWIYEYYRDGEHQMTRHMTFKNGRVVSIEPEHSKGEATAEPAAATPEQDLEQYEKEMRDAEKKHESQFKEIPEK